MMDFMNFVTTVLVITFAGSIPGAFLAALVCARLETNNTNNSDKEALTSETEG